MFCSYYFEEHVTTRWRNEPRNCDHNERVDDNNTDVLSIFKNHGRPFGKTSTRFLDAKEYAAAHLYVLLNCVEVTNNFME